jgi:hypothetical protein
MANYCSTPKSFYNKSALDSRIIELMTHLKLRELMRPRIENIHQSLAKTIRRKNKTLTDKFENLKNELLELKNP